jgi:Tat protein translocase TatB subunit
MFGIGFLEICIIVVVAMLLIGPKKLPELMVQVGKFFVQLRRMSNEVKSTFDQIVEEAEQDLDKKDQEELTKKVNHAKIITEKDEYLITKDEYSLDQENKSTKHHSHTNHDLH